MSIQLKNIGKKYNRQWLYRNLHYDFIQNGSYAITGHNGSGKSTLIKMLLGYVIPTEGNIQWELPNKTEPENIYQKLAFCAPYSDLPEEFTLTEVLNWYFGFKPLVQGMDIQHLITIGRLTKDTGKTVSQFSSGMKQRLKLLMALHTDVPLLLLDEPTSNLDSFNTDWYLERIQATAGKRTVIIASNEPKEYSFCEFELNLSNFAPTEHLYSF